MKKAILLPILFISSSHLMAGNDMMKGKERDICFEKYPHGSDAAICIDKSWSESNDNLSKLVKDTAKKIKEDENYNFPFNFKDNNSQTKGEVYQKRFLESQKTWLSYKKQYCLSVMAPIDTDGFDYQPSLEQCEINMNKRRIEEITLMYSPAED